MMLWPEVKPSPSGRGAAHIHGVLWLDLKEVKVKGVNKFVLQSAYRKLRKSEALESYEIIALEKFTDTFVTCTRCVTVAGEEAVRIAEEVNWHSHSSSCKKGGRRTCRWKFPRFPLARTIFVDANREDEGGRMDVKEREDILDRVMDVLVDECGGQKVLSTKVRAIMLTYPNVKEINEGRDQPGEEDLTKDNMQDLTKDNNQDLTKDNNQDLTKKKEKAKGKRKQNAGSYVKMESPEEYKVNIRKRIEEVLKLASVGRTLITYEMYEQAVVEQPRKGSEVLLQRDIDEIFINNYNVEWLVNWNANLDLSPVYDYFGTITYVTDYFLKDSTGLTEVLKTAMKQLSEEKDMRERCNEMANLFLTHRQVGECEAIYKLFANMNMTYSSVATIFVPTEPKGHRRQFLQRQDPESGQGFKVEGREGHFLEKPDLISKYERRKLLPKKGEEGEEEEMLEKCEAAKTLEQLTFCQYIKMYEGKGWQQRMNEEGEADQSDDEDRPDEGELEVEDDLNYLITGRFDEGESSRFNEEQHSSFNEGQNSKVGKRRKLPQLLTLRDPMPGEPKILHKRTFPRALRFFKKKYEKNPHLFYFTKLMLFHPFRDENELFPEDPQRCEELYLRHKQEIQVVEAQLLPFMESVEEAQVIYEQMRANDEQDIEDKMGADLDPEMEQEIADGDDLDDEEHPDYYHIDPNQLEADPDDQAGTRSVFKTIVLPSKDLQVILIY